MHVKLNSDELSTYTIETLTVTKDVDNSDRTISGASSGARASSASSIIIKKQSVPIPLPS